MNKKRNFLKEKKKICRVLAVWLAAMIFSQPVDINSVFFSATISQAALAIPRDGIVAVEALKVKKVVGGTANVKTGKGTVILLEEGQDVTIKKQLSKDGLKWYQISFQYGEETYQGYVRKKKIALSPIKEEEDSEENEAKDNGDNKQSESNDNNSNDTYKGETVDTEEKPITVLNAEEFETAMEEQGFPESYKPFLRELHETHPFWTFEAYQTGLKWSTVIKKQSKVGRNLIPISKGVAWKSTEQGAYNWTNDKFTIFDGTTWVSASKKAIKYYMDPRNFLNETGIYQFELLSYNATCQNTDGVANILNNTPMANKVYTYTDPDTGETEEITYIDTFLKAAEISGVSPFHLASRVRQEVVTGPTSFSNSANGIYSGYEGYYNFYNIGANDSAGGGAIAKGLTYAKKTDETYYLPWTSPFRSIVGGAVYIGKSYINKGQNTLYLEKFNVTPVSTYNHQYMTNVEASYSEALKIQTAYSEMEEMPLIFSIPVYTDMPEAVCAKPKKGKNPNNWLNTLNVTGYTLTPSFQIEEEVGIMHSLIVENSVEDITIDASTVSSLASISGIGDMALEPGDNLFTVQVTAENGTTRDYTIHVVRKEEVE